LETIPRSRVVLFGASNVTRSFPLVVSRLHAALPGPIDVLAAIGEGRSYGSTSRFFARRLPGMLQCGLWRALEERSRVETRALLGDLGNDLVYGAEVGEIVAWIEEILDRLRAHDARCALVRLPLENVQRISRLRFALARSLFYPGRPADLDALRARARELDARTVELARSRGVALVAQKADWYGLDPIHVRGACREEVCDAWLDPICGGEAARRSDAGTGARHLGREDRIALGRIRAAERRVFGVLRTSTQPCARLLDGTTISVY